VRGWLRQLLVVDQCLLFSSVSAAKSIQPRICNADKKSQTFRSGNKKNRIRFIELQLSSAAPALIAICSSCAWRYSSAPAHKNDYIRLSNSLDKEIKRVAKANLICVFDRFHVCNFVHPKQLTG